jgi:enoyl-CoA hydratase
MEEILFTLKNGLGLITLNRPQALNALTLEMVRLMDARLKLWAEDDAVRAVVIMGAGDKAFCAGGDVKAVALGDDALKTAFFREEYILNHRIHAFPKPYIALVSGIVMGGGKGVSAHGSHRVVSETTVFAMPETNIGFFPDVGGGYFLPRCPGETGTYLALTSRRIGAADCLYIGFGTHFVPAKDFPALIEALKRENSVDDALKNFAAPAPGISELAPLREKIDRCFGHDRVEDIVAALEEDNSGWARETLAAMLSMSPTSLKVALRQIRLGAKMDFADVMTMEYRLSQRLCRMHDSYEGIRAALIDKDRKPRWNPPVLEGVDDGAVKSYFQSLGDKDLVFGSDAFSL